MNNCLFFAKVLDYQVRLWYSQQSLPECIIPVPVYHNTLHQRGFNQVYELTSVLAKTIKVESQLCFKKKKTARQAILNKTERLRNLKQAFGSQYLPYSHIAILDDVVTTGSTIKALIKAIRLANPQSLLIDVWCLCR